MCTHGHAYLHERDFKKPGACLPVVNVRLVLKTYSIANLSVKRVMIMLFYGETSLIWPSLGPNFMVFMTR